jgi:transposase-like protein
MNILLDLLELKHHDLVSAKEFWHEMNQFNFYLHYFFTEKSGATTHFTELCMPVSIDVKNLNYYAERLHSCLRSVIDFKKEDIVLLSKERTLEKDQSEIPRTVLIMQVQYQ